MLNEDEQNKYTCKTETAKGYQELLVSKNGQEIMSFGFVNGEVFIDSNGRRYHVARLLDDKDSQSKYDAEPTSRFFRHLCKGMKKKEDFDFDNFANECRERKGIPLEEGENLILVERPHEKETGSETNSITNYFKTYPLGKRNFLSSTWFKSTKVSLSYLKYLEKHLL